VPDFVVDLPGGGGKVELVPDSIERREAAGDLDRVVFRNWAGETFEFHDLVERVSDR
jgi:lysine 2,3-aminomutase